MIYIIKQPRNVCPVPVSGDVRLKLSTDEHLNSAGRKASMNFRLTSNVGNDGDTFTALGINFTVRTSGDPYDQFSFRFNEATVEEAQQNLANMLRCNPQFIDASIFVTGLGFVTILWNDFRVFENTVWVNDVSGATNIDFQPNPPLNGLERSVKDYFIYYRLFGESQPLSELFSTKVPVTTANPYGQIIIDLKEKLKDLLETTIPEFSLNAPFIDSSYSRKFTIAYGSTNILFCDPVDGKTYTTDKFTAVNALFPLDDPNEFLPYCFDGTTAKFITDRPDNDICLGSYEWFWMWIDQTPYFNGDSIAPPFIVEYSFQGSVGPPTVLQIPLNIFGVTYIIPVGTENPFIKSNIDSDTVSYSIKILGKKEDLTYADYSETKTFEIVPCHCKKIEMYYISNKGDLATILLEKKISETLEVEAEVVETRIDIDDNLRSNERFFNTGGRSNIIKSVDKEYVLQSAKIQYRRDEYKRVWEYFLKSPKHFIRTQDKAGNTIMRRVIIDREATKIYDFGTVIRFNVKYKFTNQIEHF